MNGDSGSVVLVARGARHAEDLLLDSVLEHLDVARGADPLSEPIQIVVPSHSLREHLLTRLVQRSGRSLLGVRCNTHRGLALQILENVTIPPPRGLDVFAILARRFARQEPALVEALDHLVEGYSGMLGSVRDLLDAGFEIPHLRGVEEALEAEGAELASQAEVERALALTRTTARVLAAFAELEVGRTSTLLQRATEAVADTPQRALRARAVLLHGFADATGVTTDLLTTLLRTYGGALVVDRPPDPVSPEKVDSSAEFTSRFVEHFQGFAETVDSDETPSVPEVTLFRALGRHAEVREVAHRVRDLLDAGVSPESVGLVMREPGPYRSVLRRELSRLAIPFSGFGVNGPLTPHGRRLRALLELVTRGPRCHLERWLDALAPRTRSTPLFDIRVALAALGVARLEQLAELDLGELPFGDSYPLPVRQGFFEAEEDADGATEVRTRRRRVPREVLEQIAENSRQLVRLFERWSEVSLTLSEHAERLRELVEALAWTEDQPGWSEILGVIESLHAAPPIEVERDELALVLRRQLAEAGQDRFGGAGSGVQVLGVIDARGRTFEHLFLLGLNRGVFPRTVREDPVLSDALRRVLERGGHGVLPDLPIKRRGYDEERYLFAHLLSASPKVTVSWLELDDADRAMPASPLVERLRWTHPDRPVEWRSPPVVGRHPVIDGDLAGPGAGARIDRLPLDDQAMLAGLHGRRESLPHTLELALQAAHPTSGTADLDLSRAAEARVRILNEIDPETAAGAQSCLSPYFGFVGPSGPADPRSNRRLYVTVLERMAACPWQTFIERLLRIEAVPDPLEALPRIDALLIGILTHRVLERLVARKTETPSFERLREAPRVTVRWPDSETLEKILEQESDATVRRAGIALGGFARALAAVTRGYLEVAREVEWRDDELDGVLGAEVEGHLDLSIADLPPRLLAFRADRVDRRDGTLLLVDYKTGKPAFDQRTPRGRRNALLRDVGGGRRLQAVVYALAAGAAGDRGRLSFLRPLFEGPGDARVVDVGSEDTELRSAFRAAAGAALSAWEYGLFFPRMELPGRPHDAAPACAWCKVAEACLRQDSGARRRLRDGLQHLPDESEELSDAIASALLDHWWLPDHESRPGGASS